MQPNTDLHPIRVRYFASLRDEAGLSEELIENSFYSAFDLYQFLKSKHGFSLNIEEIRVAINGEFGELKASVSPGDEVVFIPPVSGG